MKEIPIDKVRSDVERALTELAYAEHMQKADLAKRTCEINRKLANVVQHPPYEHVDVYAKGITSLKQGDSFTGEWLYDLCWLQYQAGDSDYILRMPLALECEWGNDTAIFEDFQKLLVSRATLRVMVFGEKNRSNNTTVEILKEHIKRYRDGNSCDRYLLVGFGRPHIEFSLIDGAGKQL